MSEHQTGPVPRLVRAVAEVKWTARGLSREERDR